MRSFRWLVVFAGLALPSWGRITGGRYPEKIFERECREMTTEIVCDYILDEARENGMNPLEFFRKMIAGNGVDGGLKSLRKGDMKETNPHSIDNYLQFPFCSWRLMYSQLSRPSSPWNIAYPDQNSVYHATLVYLNEGDEIVIEGEKLPFVRYWSLQTYDSHAMPVGVLRDFQTNTTRGTGPNVYRDGDAGENRTSMGGYDIRLTASGEVYNTDSRKHINEMRALPKHNRNGFFFLFMRLYDPEPYPQSEKHEILDPIQEKCYGHDLSNSEMMVEAKRWGWACPPKLTRYNVNNINVTSPDDIHKGFKGRDIPYCVKKRETAELNYDQGAEPRKTCLMKPNSKNNFFLPQNAKMSGLFPNKDANYLLSCGENDGQLWARVSGVLPQTPTSLYSSPYIGNFRDYDIRYVSISSVNRSPPSLVYQTLKDGDIVDHYVPKTITDDDDQWRYPPFAMEDDDSIDKGRNHSNHRYHPDRDWNREYEIWFGPDAATMPSIAKRENAIFVPWPREMSFDENGEIVYGNLMPFPAILYREIMAQDQVFGEDANYTNSVNTIIRDDCLSDMSTLSELARTTEEKLQGPYCYDAVCCGDRPPACCRDREHISAHMEKYYPTVTYFRRVGGHNSDDDGELVEL